MKKKIRLLASLLTIITLVVILTNSCKQDENNDPPNTFRDIDGNLYHTVTIGTQVWMKENLKVTHYRNGDSIPNVKDNIQWMNLRKGAYCNPFNTDTNAIIYGRFYNWYAVNDSRKLAPTGWHIPKNSEWKVLTTYLGGEASASGKIKEAGTEHWWFPNVNATNESGFTALPSGFRNWIDGKFAYFGYEANWWTSSIGDSTFIWYRSLWHGDSIFGSSYTINNMTSGYSIRCIKD